MDKRRIARLAVLLGVGALFFSCGIDTFEGDDPLDQREETAHGVYLFAAGDAVDTLFQETYYVWLFNQLGVTPSQPLVYHKYQNLRHMEGITGRFTDGFNETGTLRFHSIWAADNHESVHAVVTTLIGHPPALIHEGIATAHQTDPLTGDLEPRWEGELLDNVARLALLGGDMPALDQILESADFFNFDRNLVFPVAGSFVSFLLDEFGYTPVLELVAQANFNDTAAQFRATFETIIGESIDTSWARWGATVAP